MVCSYLERPEWSTLRLACASLYLSSLHAFTNRYFRSVPFIVTNDGLCELEELASNEVFRARVRELCMIPTVFEGRRPVPLLVWIIQLRGVIERGQRTNGRRAGGSLRYIPSCSRRPLHASRVRRLQHRTSKMLFLLQELGVHGAAALHDGLFTGPTAT